MRILNTIKVWYRSLEWWFIIRFFPKEYSKRVRVSRNSFMTELKTGRIRLDTQEIGDETKTRN